jgi:hypothetical protein
MSDENTDLERRVLAHERILQALIVHMAESEPKFMERLSLIFKDPVRLDANEHDYTDTASYAEQFVREISRLSAEPSVEATVTPEPRSPIVPPEELPPELDPLPPTEQPEPDTLPPSDPITDTPVLFEVWRRTEKWCVTRDGLYFGDYHTEDLAKTAATEAVAASRKEGIPTELVHTSSHIDYYLSAATLRSAE